MPSGLTPVVPLDEHAAASAAASTSPTPTFRMPSSMVKCFVLLADARFGFRGVAGGAERSKGFTLIDAPGVPENPRRDPQLLGRPDLLADFQGRVPRLAPTECECLQVGPDRRRVRNVPALFLSVPQG